MNIKRLTLLFVLVLVGITLNSVNPVIAYAAVEPAEEADTVLPADRIITGEMSDYNASSIVVDNVKHNFCKKTIFFNFKGEEIPFHDIDAAREVKLFENISCIRKIKVLRFAE